MVWLIASSASIVGLAAIWAALSRRHWFLRTAMFGGLLSSLAVVPAYDLVMVFLAETLCIAVPLLIWRVWRSRRIAKRDQLSRLAWHFRLADLFLLTAVVAVAVLLGKNLPDAVRGLFATYLIWGAASGCAVLIGFVSVACAPRWLVALLILIVLPPLAAIVPANLSTSLTDIEISSSFLDSLGCPGWIWYPTLPLTSAVVFCCLQCLRAAGLGVGPAVPRDATPNTAVFDARRSQVAPLALIGLSLAILALPVAAYYQMLTPTPVPVVELPTPNAYDELRRIGEELAAGESLDVDTASEATLRTFVAKHEKQFEAARAALAFESVVPVDYSPGQLDFDFISAIRDLGRALLAEGQVAELEDRRDDACDCYLLLARAGALCGRGGLRIHWLISRILLSSGLDALQRMRGRLSLAELRTSCAELGSLEALFEPIEAVNRRERIWQEHQEWVARIRFLQSASDEPNYEHLERSHQAELRLLLCDLAIRVFQRERGRLPERLDDLIPDYLSSLPIDPFTNRLVIYRPRSDDFSLYSTGPDQLDNGGIQNTRTRPPPDGEDIVLLPPEDD